MIRALHRVRGASAVGARHPGETGPFGVRPHENSANLPLFSEDHDQDDLDDDGQDAEDDDPARKTGS
ncbi:hypothetical protein ABT063_15590 [Streptomyces sp. NPDC002838]|uniref:hypothetical protein n=1 Tax=Streptomyces sp. NPDC002838 TaxID=3154436 RepID=UPI00331A79AC